MLCLDADLSICLQHVAFRLIPLVLPSSSSMEFLECEREYAMYSTPEIGQVHASFKAKTSVQTEKSYGKANSCAENERTRKCRGRTAMRLTPRSMVNTTGRPW